MRKSFYAFVMALSFVGFMQSQAQAQLNIFWEDIGPNNMGNHVRGIAVDGNGVVWGGSVGGGLWTSTNGGSSWSQVGDVSDNLAVSSIAIDGNNIYVGTGETYFYEPDNNKISSWKHDSVSTFIPGFHQYAGQPGEGVFVSTDGGNSFTHNNGTWSGSSTRYDDIFMSIQKVAAGGGRVYIATLEGLYWSSDANLATVTKSTGTSYFEDNPILDVEVGANGVVFATTRDSLYRSTNNGASFGAAINSDVPTGTMPPNNRLGGDRVEVAISPVDASTVYVTGASDINGSCTGVWRSKDSGVTWTAIAPFESATFQPLQNNGLYSIVLAGNPLDADGCFLGGEKLYKYDETNGWDDAASHSFVPGFTTNYVPTPILSLAFDPSDDSTFYVGTDQEIVRTNNLGDTYSFKTKGFNNAHLYGVSAAPNWKILASDRYRGLLFKNSGSSNTSVQQFNDIRSTTGGGIGRWSMTNPTNLVVQTTDGGLLRSLSNGATFESFYAFPITPIHPSYGSNPDSIYVDRPDSTSAGGGNYDAGGAPVTPWAFDEVIATADLQNDTSIQNTPIWLYMCSRHFVWVCTNPFGTLDSLPAWNRVTNDIITDFFGVGKKEFFTAIAVSGDNDHVVYVGTNNGKIYRIEDANDPVNMDLNTKVLRVDTGQGMPTRWVSSIAFDQGDRDNLVVTYGSYAPGDDRVYITNNAKAAMPSFRSIQGNLQSDLPVYSSAFHPDPARRILLIGTEEGVYATTSDYTTPGGITWNKESDNVGNVPVTDIQFRRYYMNWIDNDNYKYSPDNTLFIATHGRGVFKSSSLVDREEPTLVEAGIGFNVAPNPTSDWSKVNIELNRLTKVEISAFNLQGQRIALLADRMYAPGNHSVDFDARNLPAGMYLIKAVFSNNQGQFEQSIKTVVAK